MKAIRDKIPFDTPGRRYGTLDGMAFIDLLVKKLHEEAIEIGAAVAEDDTAHVVEELADLIEVALAIAVRMGIHPMTVEVARGDKLALRGGFSLGHVIA